MFAVDGAVDFNEYKDMLKQKQENDEPLTEDSDEKKRQQFALFDKDNDGMISPTEVFGVLSNLNFARELSEEDIEQQVEEIMRRHDSDDDGMLTFAGIEWISNQLITISMEIENLKLVIWSSYFRHEKY